MHTTKINGTIHNITSGKTKVGGTNYQISNGKTKIGGTNYEVLFTPKVGGYLMFTSENSFSLKVSTKKWDGTLYYSTNGRDFSTWNGTEIFASYSVGLYRLYLKGSGNTTISGGSDGKFIFTGTNINCEGNIETLLDYETVDGGNHPTMGDNCFERLFYGCTELLTPPQLKATTLSTSCYRYMFFGCTKLQTLPKLDATELKEYCYDRMFQNCSSIFIYTTNDVAKNEYRLPTSGTIETIPSMSLYLMFLYCSGNVSSTPSINTTYYVINQPV